MFVGAVSAPPECGEGNAKVLIYFPGCELDPKPGIFEIEIEPIAEADPEESEMRE